MQFKRCFFFFNKLWINYSFTFCCKMTNHWLYMIRHHRATIWNDVKAKSNIYGTWWENFILTFEYQMNFPPDTDLQSKHFSHRVHTKQLSAEATSNTVNRYFKNSRRACKTDATLLQQQSSVTSWNSKSRCYFVK